MRVCSRSANIWDECSIVTVVVVCRIFRGSNDWHNDDYDEYGNADADANPYLSSRIGQANVPYNGRC